MPGEKARAKMASSPSTLNLKPLFKEETPLMLRDFLRDDFSSCSSNGFKSFPRRQCCPAAATTVRLLLEFDLQKPKPNHHSNPRPKPKPPLFHHHNRRSTTATTTTTTSAFHRASEAVRRAVKSLPFHSSSTSSVVVSTSGLKKKSLRRLPRSLSRQLLRKSFFWRKVDPSNNNNADNVGPVPAATSRESVRWRSFREFLEEQNHAPPPPVEKTTNNLRGGAAAPPAAVVARISTSSESKSNNSWSGSLSESEFTADSGGSESYSGSNNDSSGKKKNDSPSSSVSGGRAVTACEESSTEIAKQGWPNEEKEQFSPVSVLDCPFNDEEEEEVEVNSSFHHQTLVRLEGGSKKKVTMKKKNRRFDCLAQLQPLDLQKRITSVITEDSSSSSDIESSSSSTPELLVPPQFSQPCSTSREQVEELITRDPHELLSIVKERAVSSSSRGLISKAELLLLDYLEEKKSSNVPAESQKGCCEEELMEAVEEWVNGEQKEMFKGWEVKESRYLYLKHMEEINGGWRNVVGGEQGKEEVGEELEHEIFSSLIDEVVLELH